MTQNVLFTIVVTQEQQSGFVVKIVKGVALCANVSHNSFPLLKLYQISTFMHFESQFYILVVFKHVLYSIVIL